MQAHRLPRTDTSILLKASLFLFTVALGSYLKHHLLVLKMRRCMCVSAVCFYTCLHIISIHFCNAAAEPVDICLDGQGKLSQ